MTRTNSRHLFSGQKRRNGRGPQTPAITPARAAGCPEPVNHVPRSQHQDVPVTVTTRGTNAPLRGTNTGPGRTRGLLRGAAGPARKAGRGDALTAQSSKTKPAHVTSNDTSAMKPPADRQLDTRGAGTDVPIVGRPR